MSTAPRSLLLAPTLADLGGTPRGTISRLHDQAYLAVQFSAVMPGTRPGELDQSARRDVLATLRRNELMLAGFDLWIPARHFFEPEHVDRAVSSTLATIELASDLGRCPVSMTLPALEADAASETEVMAALGVHAERFGVTLVDHALPVADRSSIGVGFDPTAWLARGDDPVSGLLANAELLTSARLCDLLTTGLRGPIGDSHEGQLDVAAYAATLSVIGYERPVVVDARQWHDPWGGLVQTSNTWDTINAQP